MKVLYPAIESDQTLQLRFCGINLHMPLMLKTIQCGCLDMSVQRHVGKATVVVKAMWMPDYLQVITKTLEDCR